MAASARQVRNGLATAEPPARRPPPSVPPKRAPTRQQTHSSQKPARVFAIGALLALILGWWLPTERYITPERGVGYTLGIVGGSCMLLLLLYSARKRVRWLRAIGPVARWFRGHMVLGIIGPLCILYHSNFGLGATNSNVALFSMLTVAGSGLVGRYIYSRIHLGLYGRKLDLRELQDGVEGLRAAGTNIAFLPELVTRLEACEKTLLASGPRLPMLGFAKPVVVAVHAIAARLRLHRYVRKALRAASRQSAALAGERTRLRRAAFAYVDKRLLATRRVAEFEGYERLFSLWHALHLPLIFMLLVAGIVHVIAVNVY